jgi:hypothetical protein
MYVLDMPKPFQQNTLVYVDDGDPSIREGFLELMLYLAYHVYHCPVLDLFMASNPMQYTYFRNTYLISIS